MYDSHIKYLDHQSMHSASREELLEYERAKFSNRTL